MSEIVKTLLADNVENIRAQLDDLTLDDLKLALEIESAGQKRKGVVDALTTKIAALEEVAKASNSTPNNDKGAINPDSGDSKDDGATQENTPAKPIDLKNGVDGLGRPLAKKTFGKAKPKGEAKKGGPVDGLGNPL